MTRHRRGRYRVAMESAIDGLGVPMPADAELMLEQSNQRVLDPEFEGDILIWDIDKTYLDTRFSSFRGLLTIPFESAIDKRAIPGTVPLLRALRRGPHKDSALVPLYFISGSPPQLRKVIERRMTLDGVDFDGITFKDQLGYLLKARPKGVKHQVGYKLTALLLYRLRSPVGASWILFGDDVESDADVFTLFGEICAGLRGSELAQKLRQRDVEPQDIDIVTALAEPLGITEDPVERVFIHLEGGGDPESLPGERRIVPTRSYVQTALVLLAMGRIREEAVSAVARDLRVRGMGEVLLRQHVDDACDRLGVSEEFTALARR